MNTTNATPLLLQHLARLLRPVQQNPPRNGIWLCLTYHFKSDGSEAMAAAQDALMTACRALQPTHATIHVEGHHSRSPKPPRAPGGSAAVTHGSLAEEVAAWVRFARGAAAALPSLRELQDRAGLLDIWGGDSARYLGWPMWDAFRAARSEEA